MMIARIIDELSFIAWTKTKDAKNGANRPKSLINAMLNKTEEKDTQGYESGADFEKARAEILKRAKNGG